MPSSPKSVYKKPGINGVAPYDGDPPPDGGKSEDHGAPARDPKDLHFWPLPRDPDGGRKEQRTKKDDPPRKGPSPVSVNQGGASAEAARRRAEEEALAREVAKKKEEGFEQGRARAEKEHRRLLQEAEKARNEARETLRQAHSRAGEIVASSEETIVELAVAVAERLVRAELSLSPDTVRSIVRETLDMLNGGEQVAVFVHPEDLPTCRDFGESLREEFPGLLKLEMFSDETMTRGSCRVESESGVAEYSLDEEHARLREKLLEVAAVKGERGGKGGVQDQDGPH